MIVDPLRDYFELDDPPAGTVWMMGITVAITGLLLPFVWRLGDIVVGHLEGWYHDRRQPNG